MAWLRVRELCTGALIGVQSLIVVVDGSNRWGLTFYVSFNALICSNAVFCIDLVAN